MSEASAGSQVRPLDSIERRVLGVLIEKAKTTPDGYPLSLNAVITGCNQKSNRDPLMTLDEEQVTRALTSLRASGAVAEVYGNGRLARYRHLAYEWLATDREPPKEEVAILGELLLRGAQTEGDLRGRASRMDHISDLDALRSFLDAMAAKGLIVWLSPPGRGRMLTHGLMTPEQLAKVQAKLGTAVTPVAAPAAAAVPAAATHAESAPPPAAAPAAAAVNHPSDESLHDRVAALEATVADLAARLATLEEIL
ncbi:MAG: DUF480 domain-containing protein [Planctomycetota bacterium]|nr:DUF480 domain-containing protein [Planctomycetota bacterium]MDA1040953.1 DUF480 domain-containing protein [Planctomycetota bacterium]